MKSLFLASLALVFISSSATARERAFRAAPVPQQTAKVSTQCSFVAKQVSGFRTRAKGRNICYYECRGSVTATTINSLTYCPDLVNVELEATPVLARTCLPGTRCHRSKIRASASDPIQSKSASLISEYGNRKQTAEAQPSRESSF